MEKKKSPCRGGRSSPTSGDVPFWGVPGEIPFGEVKGDPHLQMSPRQRWLQAPIWGHGQDPPWKNPLGRGSPGRGSRGIPLKRREGVLHLRTFPLDRGLWIPGRDPHEWDPLF